MALGERVIAGNWPVKGIHAALFRGGAGRGWKSEGVAPLGLRPAKAGEGHQGCDAAVLRPVINYESSARLHGPQPPGSESSEGLCSGWLACRPRSAWCRTAGQPPRNAAQSDEKGAAAGNGAFPLQGMEGFHHGQKPGGLTIVYGGHGSRPSSWTTAIIAQRLVGPFADRTFRSALPLAGRASQRNARTRRPLPAGGLGGFESDPGTVGGGRPGPGEENSGWNWQAVKNGCPRVDQVDQAPSRRAAADPIAESRRAGVGRY